MSKKCNNEQFLDKLKQKNTHLEDFEILEPYQTTHAKIKCYCKKCNKEFITTPHSLLENKWCNSCNRIEMLKAHRKTQEQFIEEIALVNPDVEILGTYQGSHTKLSYRCKNCGNIAEQTPTVLLQGHGCRLCANKRISKARTLEQDEVDRRFDEIKNYVKVIGEYKGAGNKIECECVVCGYHWNTIPNVLWFMNCKCPQCNFSHGETKIKEYLLNHNVVYECQKKFDDLRGINNGYLSYDFYLPEFRLAIEYQGEQHEKPVKHFGYEKYLNQQEHDKRKREYAQNNDFTLLEIWYYDYDKINEILDKALFDNEDKIKEVG